MHIHRGIKVSIRHVMTDGTEKQFSLLLCDALAASVGKPFPLGAASRAVLGCPMRIDFDGDCVAYRVGLVFTGVVDLASKLIGLPAVDASRLASPGWLDLAQSFKEQHTAGILRADIGNDARNFVGGIFIHPSDMSPDLLIAVLAFHRRA